MVQVEVKNKSQKNSLGHIDFSFKEYVSTRRRKCITIHGYSPNPSWAWFGLRCRTYDHCGNPGDLEVRF